MAVIGEAGVIFNNYAIEPETLAASIRHPRHVVEAAMIGADVATLPPDVLKKLLLHPLTDRGLEQFLADWNKLAARAKASELLQPPIGERMQQQDRKSTRLNSSHLVISYAVFCLKNKKTKQRN